MTEKKIITSTVLENSQLTEGIFKLVLKAPFVATKAKCGQFVNVYTNNQSWLLPRPISICGAKDDILTLVYGVVGKGTEEFSHYKSGNMVKISTPLGNGYNIEKVNKGDTALLVGGGIGVPPMCLLAEQLIERGTLVTAVIGFRDKVFLKDRLEKIGATVFVTTDSGAHGFQGNALDFIKEKNITANHYFACGPKVMLKFLSLHVLARGGDIQVSMEERMGCGFGACVGCTCDVYDESKNIVRKKLCKDGPVLLGSEVVWDD